MTQAVYHSEDLFKRLPLHGMWWPAFGGLAVGLGGLLCPRALGVGFETIGDIVHERLAVHVLLVFGLVKLGIGAISLGSGTSGGVLGPLLMLSGALGALEAHWFPGARLGFWPLISMGAVVGGTMRSPLTGVVFAIELTHDMNLLLPLVIAVTVAHALTVLASPRSILTEKLVRRGLHVSREYEIGSFDTLVAADVMNRVHVVLAADGTLAAAHARVGGARGERAQHLYPVVDADARLVGAITHERLVECAHDERTVGCELSRLAEPPPPTVFGNQPLHTVVELMAEQGRTRVLVVDPANPTKLLGTVALHDLLAARAEQLGEEERRERVLSPLRALPRWLARSRPVESVARGSSGR
jgi:CBS domain-containing protein